MRFLTLHFAVAHFAAFYFLTWQTPKIWQLRKVREECVIEMSNKLAQFTLFISQKQAAIEI